MIASGSRSAPAIPLADAPALRDKAKRTRILRIGLSAALVVLLVLCLLSAFRLRTRPTSFFAHGGGFVVADFSRSIDPRAYARMGTLLRTLADSDQRLGLIVFADDAYEMLPPGTRGDAIRPMLRYFAVGKGATAALTLGAQQTPWSSAFLGGTSIGRGLRLARLLLETEPTNKRSVLLVSDLDDASSDVPLMTEEIGRYRDDRIRLRVIPLFPSTGDLAFFTGLSGPGAILSGNQIAANARIAEEQAAVGDFPIWLVVVGSILLLALGASELLARRLDWRSA
jgi:hypothetical protein